MKHITIIGGGISGLTLAWLLIHKQSHPLKITLCEATDRLGGWIRTESQSGFFFEQGPRILRTAGSGRYSLRLVQSLDIAEQMISPPINSRKRFLFCNGRLRQSPESLSSLIKWSPTLLKATWTDLTAPKISQDAQEESVADFVSRRLGSEVLDRFFDPFINGIYAGDPSKLSMRACFPQLIEWEATYGSLVKGFFQRRKKEKDLAEQRETVPTSRFIERWQQTPLWSLKGGLETLVKTLEAKIKQAGVEIRLECPVVKLTADGEGVVVKTAEQGEWRSDRVYTAISPNQTAKICLVPFKVQPTASVASVSIGYRQSLLPYEGFGHLVSSSEKEDVLGVIWDSALFPQHNSRSNETRLTVLLGGIRKPELLTRSQHELEGIALHAVSRQLGIRATPAYVSVAVAHEAIPQPEVGIEQRLEELKMHLPKYVIPLGAGWNGVSVNDCIEEAYKVCEST